MFSFVSSIQQFQNDQSTCPGVGGGAKKWSGNIVWLFIMQMSPGLLVRNDEKCLKKFQISACTSRIRTVKMFLKGKFENHFHVAPL